MHEHTEKRNDVEYRQMINVEETSVLVAQEMKGLKNLEVHE